jgi:hypothetical protein
MEKINSKPVDEKKRGFAKQEVAFKDKNVFGSFKGNLDSCFCVVSRLLFTGLLETNGMISQAKAGLIKKSDAWSYIYYLYYYNSTDIEVFKAMKEPKKGKASAVLFRRAVLDKLNEQGILLDRPRVLKPQELAGFINIVLKEEGDNIVSPIFDYLKMLLDTKVVNHLEGIKLVTGNSGAEARFVTGQAAKNANIKISFVQEKK